MVEPMTEFNIGEFQLARQTNKDRKYFKKTLKPMLNDAIASTKDNALLEDALKRADDPTILARAAERERRDQRRYGISEGTALEQADLARKAGLNQALSTVDTMNNAALAQADRNERMSQEISNVGRTLKANALGLWSSVAQAANDRNIAAQNAEAQDKAGLIQLGGQAGGMILSAVFA